MQYIAYLHKNRKSDYGVSFPDFPGCITAGKTLEEAHRLAREVLTLHVAGLVEDGHALPSPSTLDALASDPALKGAVAFLVPLDDRADRTVRINVTAREQQLQEIDRRARKAGLSRSAYIVRAALAGSPRRAA